MAQKPFGRILFEARERQGLKLEEVSRNLRVREDILRAIEHNDFSHMPARGYARNMVGSYARLLGLNASAITNQYLQESNAYQVSLREDGIEDRRTRTSTRRTAASEPQRERRRRPADADYDRSNPNGRQRRSSRNGAQREGISSPNRSRRDSRERLADGDTIGRNGRRVYDARNVNRSNGRRVPYEDSFVQRSEMRNRGFQSSVDDKSIFSGNRFGKIPIVIGLVVLIIVLFFVISNIVSCASVKSANTNSSVPITGVSDTTNSGQNTESSNTVTETAPTSCLVQYEVPSGTDVWLEIYENDSSTPSLAEIVSGPTTAAYTVTTTWKLVSPSPTAVSVTCDGTPVELTENDSGTYEATVDFAVILNQWVQTHKSSSTTANANKTTSA